VSSGDGLIVFDLRDLRAFCFIFLISLEYRHFPLYHFLVPLQRPCAFDEGGGSRKNVTAIVAKAIRITATSILFNSISGAL